MGFLDVKFIKIFLSPVVIFVNIICVNDNEASGVRRRRGRTGGVNGHYAQGY